MSARTFAYRNSQWQAADGARLVWTACHCAVVIDRDGWVVTVRGESLTSSCPTSTISVRCPCEVEWRNEPVTELAKRYGLAWPVRT